MKNNKGLYLKSAGEDKLSGRNLLTRLQNNKYKGIRKRKLKGLVNDVIAIEYSVVKGLVEQ
ncbi:MAG: hypothetical protein ACLR9T_02630 [Thomasclavelia sp.]|uniref:hypothetical protein n=1 Tax=Thomasclavelia sp. TaxID=3025757 RepID=UPI0039A013A9